MIGLSIVRVLSASVVASLRVVFLRFVVSVAEVRLPVAGVVISASVLTVVAVGVALVISSVAILRGVVHGHLLDLVVVMLVMVGVGRANLLGVSVVVGTLGDDVVLTGESHSEVERLVLGILVVVGVVLVAVSVLRGHVVVSGILIVVRLVGVALVVLVSRRVVTFVMGTSGVRVLSADMAASVSIGNDGMGGFVVRGLVVDWGNNMSSNMSSLVVDGSSNVMRSLVMNSGVLVEVSQVSSLGMSRNVRCLVVDWGSDVVRGDLVMGGGDGGVVSRGTSMSTGNVMRLDLGVDGSLVLNMDGVLNVMHGGVGLNLVVSGGVRSLVVDWGSNVVNRGNLVMSRSDSVVNWSSNVMSGNGLVVSGGVLVEVSKMSSLVVGSCVRCLVVNRDGVVQNRRVQMVRILNINVVNGSSDVMRSLVMDGSGNVVRSFMMHRSGNVRGLVMDWGSDVMGLFVMDRGFMMDGSNVLGLVMDGCSLVVDSHR